MAVRDLINLLKDSGIAAPTTGHNFLGNVPGADSTGATDMQDYILTDWSWATSDYDPYTHYAYNAIIHFAFSFTSGDRFLSIAVPFSSITAGVEVEADPGTYGEVSIVDGGYNYNPWGIAGQHGIALQIRGALTRRNITSWTAAFGYQDSTQEFTDPATEVDMYASFTPTFNNAVATEHTFPIGVTYPQTNFNDQLVYHIGNVTVAGTVANNPYDIEWYDDAAMTNLVLSGDTYMQLPGVSNGTYNYGQFWIRYREANGLWQTYNLQWWDRRTYNAYPG